MAAVVEAGEEAVVVAAASAPLARLAVAVRFRGLAF